MRRREHHPHRLECRSDAAAGGERALRYRRRGAVASLALLLGIAPMTAALAQNVGEGGSGPTAATLTPPAERLAVTPGGVDMRTGRYNFSQTDLSIGEENESGGIALTRDLGNDAIGHINPFANFSHNFDIFLDLQLVDMVSNGSGRGTRARVHFGGRSETFEQANGASWFEQASRTGYARLTFAGSVYTFTSNDGTVAVFRPFTGIADCSTSQACAYVSTVTYADGTRFLFEYDPPASAGAARLRSVASNRGYAIVFQYGSGTDGNYIVASCVINLALAPAPANHACPASPLASASYSYVTLGNERRLASATDAGAASWGYTYSALTNGFSMGFLRPGETTPWLTNTVWVRPTNDSVDEVIMHQAFADNSSYSYAYDFSPQVEGEIPQLAGGHYLDPAGHQITVRYDFPIKPGSTYGNVSGGGWPPTAQTLFYQVTPGPVEIIDALGRRSTTDYCDPNAMQNLPAWELHRCLVMPMPVSHTDAEGTRTDFLWDYATRNLGRATQHARPGTNLPDIVLSATYNCTPATMAICAKPITRADALNNVTNYEYDPVHGGLLSETGPAPIAGAPRPQTRHSYAQRSAWLANGSGGYVPAPTPVWVRTVTSSCRTSAATGNPAAPCALAGDEVRIAYEYGPDSGPNNLLLRGQVVTATDGGTTSSLRTCYGYDARGRRISETQPNANANLTSCP